MGVSTLHSWAFMRCPNRKYVQSIPPSWKVPKCSKPWMCLWKMDWNNPFTNLISFSSPKFWTILPWGHYITYSFWRGIKLDANLPLNLEAFRDFPKIVHEVWVIFHDPQEEKNTHIEIKTQHAPYISHKILWD